MEGYVKVEYEDYSPFSRYGPIPCAYIKLVGKRGLIYVPGQPGEIAMSYVQGQWIIPGGSKSINWKIPEEFLYGAITDELNRQLKAKVYEVFEE